MVPEPELLDEAPVEEAPVEAEALEPRAKRVLLAEPAEAVEASGEREDGSWLGRAQTSRVVHMKRPSERRGAVDF